MSGDLRELLKTMNALPVLKVSGEAMHEAFADMDGITGADQFFVDWDEQEWFVPLSSVVAAIAALLADTPSVEPAGRHEPGDNHDYRIECTVCGERGVIRLSVDPGRFGGREALDAGTHEPAVDDFGNQYLALLPTQASESPEKTT